MELIHNSKPCIEDLVDIINQVRKDENLIEATLINKQGNASLKLYYKKGTQPNFEGINLHSLSVTGYPNLNLVIIKK